MLGRNVWDLIVLDGLKLTEEVSAGGQAQESSRRDRSSGPRWRRYSQGVSE